MAHSERTRPPRNDATSHEPRAVSPQPPSAVRQKKLASPDQAEFALCEQTIFAISSPIVLACPTDASSGGRSTPPPWHPDAVGGRPPHQSRSRRSWARGPGRSRRTASAPRAATCAGPPAPATSPERPGSVRQTGALTPSQTDGVDDPQRHRCAKMRLSKPAAREPPAMSVSMIGLDTAKMVCSQRTNPA